MPKNLKLTVSKNHRELIEKVKKGARRESCRENVLSYLSSLPSWWDDQKKRKILRKVDVSVFRCVRVFFPRLVFVSVCLVNASQSCEDISTFVFRCHVCRWKAVISA